MTDCCKPSSGFVANIPNVDQAYPAIMSCKADGFTRMDGSTNPYASTSDVATTTASVGTTASVATTPSATISPATTECIVKLYEGNGYNKKKWEYTVTVDGKGAEITKDWKKSRKNDQLSSLCISQPGCTVWLYKHQKLRGTPKRFIGQDRTSSRQRDCGTFFSKNDLEHGMCIDGYGCSGNYNDKITSFKVVAAP